MRGALVLAMMMMSAVAVAEPRRVLVADGDPELVHAIETSLAPWKLVVVAANERVDPTLVATRATDANAEFVVWREGGELVVYDRARGATERRAARSGPLDPVTAAGAALTVKTMMRLPDEPAAPEIVVVAPPPAIPATDEPSGVALRLHAGVGGRVAHGSQTELGARGSFALMVRPSIERGWRAGIAGEFGTATDVNRAGFQGTTRDLGMFAIGSWSHRTGRVDLEPWLAGGATRSVLDGTEASGPRHEVAWRPIVRAGLVVWWPVGMWSVGAAASFDVALGTRTYTKAVGMGMSASVIYEAPRPAGVLSLVLAVELDR